MENGLITKVIFVNNISVDAKTKLGNNTGTTYSDVLSFGGIKNNKN